MHNTDDFKADHWSTSLVKDNLFRESEKERITLGIIDYLMNKGKFFTAATERQMEWVEGHLFTYLAWDDAQIHFKHEVESTGKWHTTLKVVLNTKRSSPRHDLSQSVAKMLWEVLCLQL